MPTHTTRRTSRPHSPHTLIAETKAAPALYPIPNSLASDTRDQVARLLNQRLADCIDLQTQCKQALWNVQGPGFAAPHKLFAGIDAAVAGYVDLIAGRVVQLGSVAEGTARSVAQRTSLAGYPLMLTTGAAHVAALAGALAQFGRLARIGIEEMNALHDADSAELLTEVSRGVDQWLWFVEAHHQGEPESTPHRIAW
jgi:starvation-inducible DNA-binding protein